MSRWKASAIHLALSALVLSVIAAVLVWRWYPPGLFHMARADTLLVLIGGVDLVLGPLLTLIVFKSGKKSLKFDLAVIALLQLAALVYGLHTVWESRPVYLVASDTRISLLFATDIKPEKLAAAKPPYDRLPALGPKTVSIGVSDGIGDLVAAVMGSRSDTSPAKYQPYEKIAAKLASHARPVTAVMAELSPEDRRTLERAVSASGRPQAQLGLVPIRSGRGRASMLLDTGSGELLRPLAFELPPPAAPPKKPATDAKPDLERHEGGKE